MCSESYYYVEETKGFHLWEYKSLKGEISKLFIPKWRVPANIPNSVEVSVKLKGEYVPEVIITEADLYHKLAVKTSPIVIMMDYNSEHENTVRYDARYYNRQIHSLYIPNSFFISLFPKSLEVIVEWN